MKSSFWISVFALGISLNAVASELPNPFISKLQGLNVLDTGTSPAPSPTPAPPAVPVRQGKLRAKITKMTVSKGADGNYVFAGTDVCSKETAVNVFDFRNSANANIGDKDVLSFDCPTTYLGNNVVLRVAGILFLVNGTLFDKPEDYKSAWAIMSEAGTKPAGVPVNFGTVASRDMNAHSMLSFVQPLNMWDCTKDDGKGGKVCQPAANEYFSATIEFQD